MISRILSREEVFEKVAVPLLHEAGFNPYDNPYSSKGFFKICEDYEVPHNPMKCRDEKFCWTYKQGVSWQDDYRVFQDFESPTSLNLFHCKLLRFPDYHYSIQLK